AVRMGPPRLDRWAWRALDADARPPWASRRFASARRLLRRAVVVAAVAGRAARRTRPDKDGPDADLAADDQLRAARVAGAVAGMVHGLRLRLGRRAAVDPAPRRRQRDRDARRVPRGFAAPRRRRPALGQDPAHLPRRTASMRPSLRFLALVVVGWAGIRSATLGSLPGREMFQIVRSEAKTAVPPIVPTQFPPIEPAQPYGPASDAVAPTQLAKVGSAAP